MWPFNRKTEDAPLAVTAEVPEKTQEAPVADVSRPRDVWDIHEVSKSEEGRGDFKLYYAHPVGEADFLDTREGFETESDALRYLDEAGHAFGTLYR